MVTHLSYQIGTIISIYLIKLNIVKGNKISLELYLEFACNNKLNKEGVQKVKKCFMLVGSLFYNNMPITAIIKGLTHPVFI